MCSREATEIDHFLKYGNPSDRLIGLSEAKFVMRVDGHLKNVEFPYSLNTAAGKKKAYSIIKKVRQYINDVPSLAYGLLLDVRKNVTHRRSDTQNNIQMVAEAVINRVASEGKPEVLFAFDSIITWVKTAYGKELGYLTIRRSLELLQAQGYLTVVEWGKRGKRGRCTKIKVDLNFEREFEDFSVEAELWVEFTAPIMDAVYARESTTRQDVLEAQIHFYADQVLVEANAESRHAQGARLFTKSSARIVTDASDEVVLETIEKVFYNDEDYVTGLLGELVSTVQAYGSGNRKVGAGIRGPD